ncbi:FAD-dependent oxidoreductase [Saccharopolyspora sp. NPDC002376]
MPSEPRSAAPVSIETHGVDTIPDADRTGRPPGHRRHTARRWRAFIDGAIESGKRTAAEVLAAEQA